jgi:hypothetical protein
MSGPCRLECREAACIHRRVNGLVMRGTVDLCPVRDDSNEPLASILCKYVLSAF